MDVLSAPTVCPKCAGAAFYDNTVDKKSPKGPDYKCKNCGEGFWLKGAKSASGTVNRTTAPAYRERLPYQSPPVAQAEEYATAPATNGNGAMDYKEMAQRFMECLNTALAAGTELRKAEVGDDPRAIAQMADTLFIQRMKMGI